MPYSYQPATKIPAKTNDAHFSAFQMKKKKDALREEERKKNLVLLGIKRKVHRLERTVGLHERLMVALTSGSARELQAVLVRASKAGLRVAAALKLVTKCLEAVYQPRPQFTELDMGIATLLYIFRSRQQGAGPAVRAADPVEEGGGGLHPHHLHRRAQLRGGHEDGGGGQRGRELWAAHRQGEAGVAALLCGTVKDGAGRHGQRQDAVLPLADRDHRWRLRAQAGRYQPRADDPGRRRGGGAGGGAGAERASLVPGHAPGG